jgi:hypothetical protein
MRNVCNILVEKPDGKRPLGRPGRRWEDNIRLDLGEIEWEVVDWKHLAQERGYLLAGSCGHGNETSGSIKGG